MQGDQTRELTAIRQGVIDMAIGSTINWSPQVKELNLFSLPFLMPDFAAADALTRGEVGKELFKALEKNNVVPLAWGENGSREISNSKRDIVRQAAVDAGKQEIDLARKGLAKADQPLLKEIAGNGVNVVKLTPSERDAFVTATRRVYAKWKAQIGAALVDRAEKDVAARRR